MNLEGAVVLIPGGAGWLGRVIAAYLRERQARVLLADRNREALDALADTWPTYHVDGADPESVQNMVSSALAQHGRLDVMVNCAGTIYSEPLLNFANPSNMRHGHESFLRVIESNLYSAFLFGASVAEAMVRKRTQGVLVNISSVSAQGNAGQTAYSAAKAGVEAMTKAWAKELGPLGIRAVSIAPGFIDTPSTHISLSETILKHIVGATPLRRLGKGEQIAQAVCSAIENDFITGTTLEVNGGICL